MKRLLISLLAIVGASIALVWWLNTRDETTGADITLAALADPTLIARGAYLAKAGNCMACHTRRGGAPGAGGRAIDTPFGTVFSTNLTPHPASGIGNWSANDFWRALHNGRSRDGRLLYPAFPYANTTLVTRADSDALFAWLRSQPAADEPNRAHALRFPYNTQAALAIWRALYFKPGVHSDDATRSAQWNRGAYLVRGLGHCSACHAARDALGGTDASPDLAGGLIPMQNWYAPALNAPHEAGVAQWSTAEVVQLLKTGIAPRGWVTGPMAEVVLRSTQHLSDEDLAAMAAYLQALPQVAAPSPRQAAPSTAQDPRVATGARLYERHCADCHGDKGQGVPLAYPALAGNRAVTLTVTANLIQTVLHGGFAPATAGNPRPYGMPPFVLQLGDADIAAVLSYVRSAWGNQAGAVSQLDVERFRGSARQ